MAISQSVTCFSCSKSSRGVDSAESVEREAVLETESSLLD